MAERSHIVIKKYPNRRLYNTSTSKYITLENLADYVRKDINFKVIDIKTKEDITRATLAQVLLEHELKGYELLPAELIKVMIKFSDHPLSKVVEQSMVQNAKNFNDFFSQVPESMDGMFPVNLDVTSYFKQFNDINKTFLDMFTATKPPKKR